MTTTTNTAANKIAAAEMDVLIAKWMPMDNAAICREIDLLIVNRGLGESEIIGIIDALNTRHKGINATDLAYFKSPVASTAEVKAEIDWFSGSNMLMAGAVLGTAADQVLNGLNVTSAVAGVVVAGAGYLMRDSINEMTGDSMVKRSAACVAGAGAVMGSSYAARAVMGMMSSDDSDEGTEVEMPSSTPAETLGWAF